MDTRDALETLGVSRGTPWEEIRAAYREQLLRHHPDAQGDESSGPRTERIVDAFRCLRDLTGDGTVEVPWPLLMDDPNALDPANAPLVLHARPGDVFVRLAQAAERIGHVSYADRVENILQVTLDSSDWSPCQLTAELTPDGEVTSALFSLEALGTAPAPDIGEVVARLAQELRAPALLDERPYT